MKAQMNNRTQQIAIVPQIHTYCELLQLVHDDLRIQHPEWVEPNGESPFVILTKRALTNSWKH
jgi:hypothetical protein